MTQPADKRLRRSRKRLQAALLELMEEKPFKKIQVKEIAERACLSRPTFYMQFDTKEELLFSHIDDVFAQVQASIVDHKQKHVIDFKQDLILSFQTWSRYRRELEIMMMVENKDLILARLRAHIDRNLIKAAEDLADLHQLPAVHDYVVDFVTGGLYMLLKRWLQEGMQAPPEKIAEFAYLMLVEPMPNFLDPTSKWVQNDYLHQPSPNR